MTIPLEQAYLCVNCDHISGNANRCGHCASEIGLMSVASVFNRPARDLKLSDAQKLHRAMTKVEQVFESCMS